MVSYRYLQHFTKPLNYHRDKRASPIGFQIIRGLQYSLLNQGAHVLRPLMPRTMDSTEPYIYCVFPIHTYTPMIKFIIKFS